MSTITESEIMEATFTLPIRYRITTVDDSHPRGDYVAGRIVCDVWSNELGDRRRVWALGSITAEQIVANELPKFPTWGPLS